MSFTLSSKSNECPHCQDTTGKCRQGNEDPDYYLCMGHNSARIGEVVSPGYKVIGLTKDGLWAQIKPDNSAEYSDEQKREWEDKKESRQLAQAKKKEEKLAFQLPAVERDRYFRRILDQLPLSQKHRDHLKNDRKMTDAQIEAGGYRSTEPWQKVKGGFPSFLPGVLPHQVLNVAGSGILCPVFDLNGLIVALRLRLDDTTQGKYRWLTSATKKNPDGATPHIDDELPLAVFHPSELQGDYIALTEGIEIKPRIACDRLGVPVLGASGGQWSASPNTAKESIEYLSEKYGTKKIVFFPDAGDVANPQVAPRWIKQFEFFTGLGYECHFAWWEQLFKESSRDIDELDDFSVIKFIGLVEFNRQVECAANCKSIIENEQKKNEEKDKKNLAQKLWIKTRKFTPDITVNHKNFNFPVEKIPENGAIIAIRSGLGTNKTGWELEEIKRNQAKGIGAKAIGYRNNLLFQTIARGDQIYINIYHLQKDDGRGMLGDTSVHLAFCLDSIKYVQGYFNGCDIHLDETCSVILHGVTGGTLGENQAQALKILTQAIQECNNCYLYDGNLSDIYVDFIAKLAPEKKVIKVLNEYKIAPHTIKFVDGIDAEGEIKKRDKSAIDSFLVKDDVKPFIYSDSKNFTDVLYKILTDLGKKGYVLNADTVGEPWAKEFLKDPDNFISKNKPDFFIGSPSIESGVSIIIKNYFTHKFSFFAGVATANSQHQGMFRLRDETIEHYVFCPEVSSIRDVNTPRVYSEKKLQSILNERILSSAMLASNYSENENATDIIAKALSRNDDEWFNLSCKLASIDNYERDHLRECLIHVLREEAGHNVEIVAWYIDEEAKQLMKDASDEVKLQRAKEIFNAVPFPTIEKAKDAKNGSPNKETQRRIEKTFLLDKIPGIESEQVWSENFVLDYHVKDKHFIGQVQKFYLFNNFEIAKKKHEADWYYKATKEDFFKGCVTGTSHQQLWALQELRFQEFIFSDKELCKDSPEVIVIWNTVKSRRDLQTALGFDQMPKEQSHGEEKTNLVKFLASIVGVAVKSAGQKTTEDGIRKRFYKFNMDALKSAEGTAIINCLAKKFEAWMQSEKAQVSWNIDVVLGVAPSQAEQHTELEIKPLQQAIISQQIQQTTVEEVKPETTITENEFVEIDCPQWQYHKAKGVVTGFDEQSRAIVSTDKGQLQVEPYWLKLHPKVVEIGNLFDRFKLLRLVNESVALIQKLESSEVIQIPLVQLHYAAG